MTRDEDLAGRPATALAEAVRARQVSPVEVVAAHLDRVEALETRVGAYQLVRREPALAEARELGERGDLDALPLAGVPVAVKDNTDVAGEPTRHGSVASSPAPAASDALPVRRLREAGAVVIGKTKVPECCLWSSTDGAFGIARNPWDLGRTPGGSSGGSAAAVAAGTVPIALGSDGLGSIRIPAAACGLVGLKPGHGGGVTEPALDGRGDGWFGMSEFGPLATTVADAALMLAVLADRPELAEVSPLTSRLRVGVSVDAPPTVRRIDPAFERAVADVADRLAAAGHHVQLAEPRYPSWLLPAIAARWTGAADEEASAFPEPDRLEGRTRGHARTGRALRRVGAVREADERRWRDRVAALFERIDVLLLPTLAQPPIEARDWHRRSWLRNVKVHLDYSPMTAAWNLAKVPAASVPAGVGADGLPLAVQVVAPHGHEQRLLVLAALLEAQRPWPRLSPLAGASA